MMKEVSNKMDEHDAKQIIDGANGELCIRLDSENVKGNGSVKPNCDNGKVSSKTNFTIKQKLSLCMLASVEFTSYCSMSIMAPFYPREAADKGMSASMAGLVFSFYAFIVFISAPVFGKLCPKIGVKCLFISGIILSGICSIIFGTLNYVSDYNLFTTLSFAIRGAEALGASAYSTAGYVLIIDIFPNNGGTVRGLMETFVGLGMSTGPAIGGLLFAIGGFGLPFYAVGVLTLLIAPLNFIVLPKTAGVSIANVKCGSFKKLLKIPSVIVTCLTITLVSSTWGFLDPTLEPHLRQFNLSPSNIGFIFLLLSASYGIFSPIWGWVTDKLDQYWFLMCSGLALSCFSLLLLGPSPIFNIKDPPIWLHITALLLLGIFVAMALMPTYQALLDGALDGGFEDNIGTHSLVAGLWSCIYSLGEMVGPSVGGALLQQWGFPVAATCIACVNLTAACVAAFYYLVLAKQVRCEPTVLSIEDKSNFVDIPLRNGDNKDVSVHI